VLTTKKTSNIKTACVQTTISKLYILSNKITTHTHTHAMSCTSISMEQYPRSRSESKGCRAFNASWQSQQNQQRKLILYGKTLHSRVPRPQWQEI